MMYTIYFKDGTHMSRDFIPEKKYLRLVEVEFERDHYHHEWTYLSKETAESKERGAVSEGFTDFALTASTMTVIPIELRGNNTPHSKTYLIDWIKTRDMNEGVYPSVL